MCIRDRPSEALSTTTVWSVGLSKSKKLVSSLQLDNFRLGDAIEQELDVRGRRGAYLINDCLTLAPSSEKSWSIVAEVNQGPAKVKDLIAYLKADKSITEDIEADIALGSENLARIVGISDGLQVTEDKLSANHHFALSLIHISEPTRPY